MANIQDSELLSKVRDKRCVFTVTAGRTGTNLLQKLFSLLPDTLSEHEPEPNFVHFMRRTQQNPEVGLAFCMSGKLPYIAQIKQSRYVETSHLFCKGFVECFFKCGIIPDIIILRRSPREIAKSLLKLNTIPARTGHGSMYLLSPDDPNVLPLPQWELMSDYQLCYWYCLEIERRQLHYRDMFRSLGAKVVETSISELKDFNHFITMATELDFDLGHNQQELRQRYLEIIGHKQNEKMQVKFSVSDDQYAQVEQEVNQRIAFYAPLLPEQIRQRYGVVSE